MQPEVAAKRQALVDALTMCLERSSVSAKVPVSSIRSILESAAGELWREGEFHLELVWRILTQQPGVTAMDVAPPLLVFRVFEESLGVNVRVPQALSALPPGEQQRLRETLGITNKDFEKAMERHEAPTTREAVSHLAAQAAEATETAASPEKSRPSRRHPGLVAGLAAIAVAATAGSVWFTLRDTSTEFDISDAASVLKIEDARTQGHAVVARLADPRWELLPKDEQRRLATAFFEKLEARGIRGLTLLDDKGRVRVMAGNLAGSTSVSVY